MGGSSFSFLDEGAVLAGAGKKRYAMSRRRLNTFWVLCILLAAVVVSVDRRAGRSRRQWTEQWGSKAGDAAKYHLKTFTAVNVVDGDTLDIDIADGEYARTRVRLLGVDTPETVDDRVGPMYFGEEATRFARQLAMDKEVTVLIDPIGDVRDRYGRLLAYLRLPDGTTLNEQLVRTGHGYADLRFTHSEFEKYVQLQEDAIRQGVGLWQEVTKDQMPGWLQRERPGILQLRDR